MHVYDRQQHPQAAVELLQLVGAGCIDETYHKHIGLQGKHHNPYCPAGFPALKKAMIASHIQFPSKQFTVKNVLGDGDLVVAHSHIVLCPGEPGV